MATLKVIVPLPGEPANRLALFDGSRDSGLLSDRLQLFVDENTQAVGLPTYATMSCIENGVQATATVTFGIVANNSTITVNNVVFTGKTSAPSGPNQFLCGVSGLVDALAFALILNANPSNNISGVVTASATGTVLTIVSSDYDYRANCYALTSSDGTNLAVVGFLGGAPDPTTLTCKI